MADDHLFLLPIVIDDTDQATARVPEKFLTVQWLKVPGGQPTRALEAVCRKVASGDVPDSKPARKALRRQDRKNRSAAPVLQNPEFPRAEPGQKIKFGVDVAVWALRSAWVLSAGFPAGYGFCYLCGLRLLSSRAANPPRSIHALPIFRLPRPKGSRRCRRNIKAA